MTNILFYCYDRHFDGPTIYSLWCSGVTVFVVDRTVFGADFFSHIKKSILEAELINPVNYYRPIGLSIVMSVTEPIDVDDRVDFVILKGTTCIDDLINFKKVDQSFSVIPILLWFSSLCYDTIPQLIKISDGVIIDLKVEEGMFLDQCPRVLNFCEKFQKPVIFSKKEFNHDFVLLGHNNRKVLEIASKLAPNYLHGILVDDTEQPEVPTASIRSLVSALASIEGINEEEKKYYGFSPKLKTPLIPPFVVALAASLAALESCAEAMLILTATGRSARWLACARPPCQVLALSTRPRTVRQMHVYRKILPLLYTEDRAGNWQEEYWNRVRFGITFALKTGLVGNGAKLVVLAPMEEGCGYCNGFQIVSTPFKCPE